MFGSTRAMKPSSKEVAQAPTRQLEPRFQQFLSDLPG